MSDVIFLDMDETLVNLVDPWLNYLNNESGLEITRDDINVYSVEDHFGEKLSRSKIFRPFKTKGFWVDLPPFEGAIDLVRDLNERYTVYLATVPALGKVCAYEKEKWMEQHLPFLTRDRLILCHHKHLLNGHALLDDKPTYLAGFQGHRLLYDRPWNQESELVKEGMWESLFVRMYSYQSVRDYLAQMELPF